MNISNLLKNTSFLHNFIKILVPFTILLILYLFFVFGIIIPTLEENLYNEKIETTKRLSQLLYSDLLSRQQDIDSGIVSEEEHKQRVINRYEKLRFGKDNSDYFWILDERGFVIMHPYVKSIVNIDPKFVQGPDGVLLNILLDKMQDVVETQNAGSVEYMWQFNEDSSILTKKISWVTKFEPWNWIIGAGVYIDDIENEISVWRTRLLTYGAITIFLSMLINLLISIKSIKSKIKEDEAINKLIESEDNIKTTLLSIGDGVISTNTEGLIIRINAMAKKILEIDNEPITDLYIFDILKIKELHSDKLLIYDKNSYFNSITRLINMNECLLITSSNTNLNISINANFIRKHNSEIEGIVIVFRDISEELKLKNEIIENEELFRTIFDISPLYMTIIRLEDLSYVSVNNAYAESYNMKISDFNHKKAGDIEDCIDNFEAEDLNILTKTGKLNNKMKAVNIKNEIHHILFSSRVITFQNTPCIFSIYSDITELKTLQEQLNHAQKMDAVGQLAGGIAHDFNNIIGGMLGILELMTIKDYSYEDRIKNLKILLNSGQRAADLTKKLLIFSRKGKIYSTKINLHKSINDAVALLERTIDKNVKISLNLNAIQSYLIGDYTQLMNVVLNMGINADHAMQDGGSLFIITNNIALDKEFCEKSVFDLVAGDYIKLTIKDTGTGIKSKDINKIFEPFFTTKEQGRGTGLGLAAVYGTIRQHHGAIYVESELNVGTTFTIYLPVAESEANLNKTDKNLYLGTGTILVVDDEYVIQVMAKAVLENLGYSVIIASNGKEALDIYKNIQDKICLVILDMVMPEMNGKECFKSLKALNPDIKIILSSGFTQESDLEELRLAGLSGFIRKPYNTSDISKLIQEVLSC